MEIDILHYSQIISYDDPMERIKIDARGDDI